MLTVLICRGKTHIAYAKQKNTETLLDASNEVGL